MRDYMTLGPTPCEESCAQVGADNYYADSKAECALFKQVLLNKFGKPPLGARFAIKEFPHDFGSYREVTVVYETDVEDATNFAYDVEGDLPAEWPKSVRSILAKGGHMYDALDKLKNPHGKKKTYGLVDLCAEYAMEEMELLEDAVYDSIVPAICTECGHVTEMEPDQDRGYCEICKQNTVSSCLVLAGLI